MNKKKPRSENPTVKDPQQEEDPNFRPWSDLDPNLLNLIISNISKPRDHLRFAAVCPSWRSASAQLTQLSPYPHPLLITPYPQPIGCYSHSPSDSYTYTVLFPHKEEKDGFFRIPGTAFASLIASSSFGWLLFSQNFKPREEDHEDDDDDDDYGYGGNKKEEIKKKNRHEEEEEEEEEDSSVDHDDDEAEEDSSVDHDDDEDDSDDYFHYEDDDIDDNQGENDDDDEEEDDKVEVGDLEEEEKKEEDEVEEDDEDEEVLYDWEYYEKGYAQLFLVNPVTNSRINLPPCHKLDIEHSESILLTAPPGDPDCALIMINSYTCYVTFCRLNAGNPRWTDMGGYERDKYGIGVTRSLYLVGSNRNAYLFVKLDLCSQDLYSQFKYVFGVSTDLMRRRRRTGGGPFLSWLSRRTAPVPGESDCDYDSLFLVESAGEILVVFLYEPVGDEEDPEEVPEFKVYKVDPKTGKFLRVCDLQDRVLYLGRRNSFSVSATTTTSGMKGGTYHIYLALDSCDDCLQYRKRRTLTDGAMQMKIIHNHEALWLLPSR